MPNGSAMRALTDRHTDRHTDGSVFTTSTPETGGKNILGGLRQKVTLQAAYIDRCILLSILSTGLVRLMGNGINHFAAARRKYLRPKGT